MTFKLNIRVILHYVLIYIFVIMHGAVVWAGIIGNDYIALAAVLVIFAFCMCLFNIGFPKKLLVYAICLFTCYFLSAMLNDIGLSSGLNIKTALIIVINILAAYVIYRIDCQKVLQRFVNVIAFFAGASLIFYSTSILLGKAALVGPLFPQVDWGRGHIGWLLYSYTLKDMRNYGIFYEPGVYEVLLVSAIYFMIFYKSRFSYSKRKYNSILSVLIITLVTTGSTTGYISGMILLCGLLFSGEQKKEHKKIGILLILFIIFFFVDYWNNGDISLVSTYVLGKIEEMQLGGGTYNADSSGGARIFIVTQALEALKKNPFFGLGAHYLETRIANQFWDGFGTGNVLFGTIATKGLVTVIATLYPLLKSGYVNRTSILQYIIFVLLFVNTTIAQSQLVYGCFALMVLIRIDNPSNFNEK